MKRKPTKALRQAIAKIPRWLRIPCSHTINPRNLRMQLPTRLCAAPGLIYEISNPKQLKFEWGSQSNKQPLCPEHRDQVIARGLKVKLCSGLQQFSTAIARKEPARASHPKESAA
jgi:hypothetical protein